MRRKFKKTVTMLASLTISISQIQTQALATTNDIVLTGTENNDVPKGGTKEKVSSDETVNTNNGTVKDNYGTVEDNEGTVENNKLEGKVEVNKGTVKNNEENAQVEVNLGTIVNNNGIVGESSPSGTVNHGNITNNNASISLNAGKQDKPDGFEPAQLEDYDGGHINNNNAAVSTNNGTIETNTKKGSVVDNNGTINENRGTVTNNNKGKSYDDNGTIIDNQNKVTNNYGVVDENNGTITNNEGVVGTNNITIKNNTGEYASVEVNYGSIDTNDEGGMVFANSGTIKENGDEGLVNANLNYIETNDGTVGEDPEFLTTEDVYKGYGNFGTIDENNGTITFNAGKDDKPGDIPPVEDDYDELDGGIVVENNSIIIINNGTVEKNAKYGTIQENSGTVDYNNGTVVTNTATGFVDNRGSGKVNINNGIVDNWTKATVTTNNGKVYNYGGTIKDNSNGTALFGIKISKGKHIEQNDNLESHGKFQWLGQEGNEQTSSVITLTPAEGYRINSINVPDKYADYISVAKDSDGNWSITIKSGYSSTISLSVPEYYIYSDNGGGSSDDSGNDKDKKPNKNDPGSQNNLLVNLEPIPGQTQGIVDNNGNPINVDLSKVLIPLNDKTTALNNFTSLQGVDTNDIKGYGMVKLSELFADASTASTISVPVGADVTAGMTYKVYLSNNTSLDVLCTQNGQLTIAFAKGTDDLTFVISGTALTPSTGNGQSENTFGPSAGDQSGSKEGPATVNQNGAPNNASAPVSSSTEDILNHFRNGEAEYNSTIAANNAAFKTALQKPQEEIAKLFPSSDNGALQPNQWTLQDGNTEEAQSLQAQNGSQTSTNAEQFSQKQSGLFGRDILPSGNDTVESYFGNLADGNWANSNRAEGGWSFSDDSGYVYNGQTVPEITQYFSLPGHQTNNNQESYSTINKVSDGTQSLTQELQQTIDDIKNLAPNVQGAELYKNGGLTDETILPDGAVSVLSGAGFDQMTLNQSSGTYGNPTEIQQQTHSAAMTASASAVALNQGMDTASLQALNNLTAQGLSGIQAFSSLGGGSARAKTG